MSSTPEIGKSDAERVAELQDRVDQLGTRVLRLSKGLRDVSDAIRERKAPLYLNRIIDYALERGEWGK